jgi:hypothetical protein
LLFIELGGLVGNPTPVFDPKVYCRTADNECKGSKDACDDVFYGVVWFGIVDADARWRALASWVGEGGVMIISAAHRDRLGREVACIGRRGGGNGGRIGSVVGSRSSSPCLLLFGNFEDEGEWEVGSG